MRRFLFGKTAFSKEDRQSPLYWSLASRTRIPYLTKNISGGGCALDAGCGIGFLSNILAQKFSRVIACDPDKKSLAKAKALYREHRIEFVEAAAERMPLPDDLADFLLCSEVLEHVQNPAASLQEMKRICKNNSKFLITVPSNEGIFKDFFLKIGHSDDNLYEKHQRPSFAKKSLAELLSKNGFQIEEINHSKIFLAEMLMGLTKLLHNAKKGKALGGQADILMPPKAYRLVFPLMLFCAELEDFFLNDVLKGHMLIASGIIKK